MPIVLKAYLLLAFLALALYVMAVSGRLYAFALLVTWLGRRAKSVSRNYYRAARIWLRLLFTPREKVINEKYWSYGQNPEDGF